MPDTIEDYLGDGVYAKIDRTGLLSITTDNHLNEASRIYLEPEVLIKLVQFQLKHQPQVLEAFLKGTPLA